jgi:hypothetical protein
MDMMSLDCMLAFYHPILRVNIYSRLLVWATFFGAVEPQRPAFMPGYSDQLEERAESFVDITNNSNISDFILCVQCKTLLILYL